MIKVLGYVSPVVGSIYYCVVGPAVNKTSKGQIVGRKKTTRMRVHCAAFTCLYLYIHSQKENTLISGMLAYFPAVEALENVDVIRKMGTLMIIKSSPFRRTCRI